MKGFLALLALSSFLCITTISSALDTINTTQSIQGNQTLVSADGSFELGFFHGDDPSKRYLGIWYKKLPTKTVVWVANREAPLANSSGSLTLTNQGLLTLLDHKETVVWSSKASRTAKNPVGELLSTGNMIVRDGDDNNNDEEEENFLWQSFDYPSDTFLPGFKLGRVLATGFDRFLTSWKTPGDPSPGNYTYKVNPSGYPQLFLSQDSAVKFSTGPWNGLRFSGTPNLNQNPIYEYGFVLDDKEMYYSYELLNSSILSRMILSSNGILQRYIWIDRTQGWRLYLTEPIDNCDTYALCGSYGRCNVVDSPVCQCLKGFVPKIGEEWERMDWSNGCARRAGLNCSEDVFLKYSGVKLPDTQRSWYNTTMNLEECKATCRKNCNCTAYANLDIRGGGSGCLLWFGDLIDIREYNDNGQDLYLRMAASEAGMLESQHNHKKRRRIILVSSTVGGFIILGVGLIMFILCKKGLCGQEGRGLDTQKEDLELPLFDFMTIAAAANNFSEDNKVGQGGFGPVYKGKLKDGQEIAVKMLSSNSNQGINEFKNEVTCIAKLQHRNLVKLIGYCIQVEKMLLYEYMPNKSLDFFIFDQAQRKLLDWDKRFNIINGIARGVLYLHQDSRLRVIHRDLKASNVLLDHEMNPKISDFGTARSFGGNETEAITDRVVGTYGYMSPEYAIDGNFSTKSDVFSYGVLLLEIVSGKKNRGFYHPEHRLNLLGHAWKLYNDDRTMELIDTLMDESCDLFEALRAIHVGLLCVQRCPEDRPSMSYVVLLLTSDIALPPPKEPGFFNEREMFHPKDTLSCKQASGQDDKMTSTILSGR